MQGKYHHLHENAKGPGDARPTALQIVEDEDLVGKLSGKTAIVTGCSSGIGIETIRALHKTGATVIATARDMKKLKEVVDDIVVSSDPSNQPPILMVEMELGSLASVRKAAEEILDKSLGKINILINNAGVMATPKGYTQDGFETQFGTNHLGHFLLFEILKPALLGSSTPSFHSRVVGVSSLGHRYGNIRLDDFNFEKGEYTPFSAYGQSKTANILMTNEIERRYGSMGLHGLAVHPGGIHTNLARHVDDERLKYYNSEELVRHFKSTGQGAATQVYAALSKDLEGVGGKYLADVEVQGPTKEAIGQIPLEDQGYEVWAVDVKAAKRLWEESLKMVGLQE